ncbi:phage major tail tube protein [Serratia liquefaciens]|nr:phage major tail tube protein [Serratia liquefaciens]
MAMPRKLKYLNTFLDGVSYLGVIESVTLPKLTRKLENYRGGGMSGSAPVDFGLDDDALAMEISLGGFPDDAIWSLLWCRRYRDAVALCRLLPAGRYRRNRGGGS